MALKPTLSLRSFGTERPSCATDFMKPSSWDKQLGLASPRESAASQSDKTNNPSKNEVRNEVGLDVSHHARISQRGGEKIFSLTSSFIG